MKLGDAFPGQYLKAGDLKGKRVQVVVDHVAAEEIGGEPKLVAHFRGKDRGLVLNKTNANSIHMINGSDDTDDWEGTVVVLFPSKTEFQGKRVDCIRIDPPDTPVARSKPEPPPVEDDDESVPF